MTSSPLPELCEIRGGGHIPHYTPNLQKGSLKLARSLLNLLVIQDSNIGVLPNILHGGIKPHGKSSGDTGKLLSIVSEIKISHTREAS